MNAQKILIVDDEEAIRDFLSFGLAKAGYKVFTAENGIDGLEQCLLQKPALIILDIRMPLMDGIEMCKRLRANPLLEHIAVIFLTADTDEYLALSSMHVGGDQYVTKPVHIPEIIEMVQDLIHKLKVLDRASIISN